MQSTDQSTRYNLSLSHGTASIVAILSLLYAQGYVRGRCYELITGALQWMWRVYNQAGPSVFPNTVTDSPGDQDSRLGWCYGDIGIANAFWLAGEALQKKAWKEIALETVLRTVPRRGNEGLIRDAGLCHGSAGVAYIFRRFAQRTGDPCLAKAVDYWLSETLKFTQSADKEAVFLSYVGETNSYEPSLSFIYPGTPFGLFSVFATAPVDTTLTNIRIEGIGSRKILPLRSSCTEPITRLFRRRIAGTPISL